MFRVWGRDNKEVVRGAKLIGYEYGGEDNEDYHSKNTGPDTPGVESTDSCSTGKIYPDFHSR